MFVKIIIPFSTKRRSVFSSDRNNGKKTKRARHTAATDARKVANTRHVTSSD
jgi:hypothetical protein